MFARKGASVTLAGRRENPLRSITDRLKAEGHTATKRIDTVYRKTVIRQHKYLPARRKEP